MKKILLLLCFVVTSAGAVSVVDDDGRTVTLPKPAGRIISTAPHITEFLFETGGAGHIAGVTSYSNYPSEAQSLPLVGDNRRIDMERVLALKPDLIIAWRGGNPVRQIDQLKRMGIPVFYSDLKTMEDIPKTLERFGTLVGQAEKGKKQGALWKMRLERLKKQYENRPVLTVFYQISERPLYTLSGKHIISEAIRICGGENIFSGLDTIAPRISIESILEKNPDVIFISRSGGSANGINFWRRFGVIRAVRKNNVFEIDADLMDRPGPRFIDGVSALCEKIDKARTSQRDQ
ncbi:MAG: cobalamin-binding protein [Oxalobacter sp.]|nr:cobalamin-binding protein [Oxalobacter sp.]